MIKIDRDGEAYWSESVEIVSIKREKRYSFLNNIRKDASCTLSELFR